MEEILEHWRTDAIINEFLRSVQLKYKQKFQKWILYTKTQLSRLLHTQSLKPSLFFRNSQQKCLWAVIRALKKIESG